MKPLMILLITFFLSLFIIRMYLGIYKFQLSARIAMSIMLVFTSIAHFTFTKGMSLMLPEFIPNKTAIVYLTGIIEIAAALGIQIPNLRIITAWLLIIFFLIILPANIYAAIKHIDFQRGNHNGNGLGYLWFRIPLQIGFIAWVYLSSLKIKIDV